MCNQVLLQALFPCSVKVYVKEVHFCFEFRSLERSHFFVFCFCFVRSSVIKSRKRTEKGRLVTCLIFVVDFVVVVVAVATRAVLVHEVTRCLELA